MRILWFWLLLVFLVPGVLRAEDSLKALVVTPQTLQFTLYDDYLTPQSASFSLACVGTRVVFTERIGGEEHIFICDFDCEETEFDWQLVSEKPWVRFSPGRGSGQEVIPVQAYIQTDYLRHLAPDEASGPIEFTSSATLRVNFHLDQCMEYWKDGAREASVEHYEEIELKPFISVYYVPVSPPHLNPASLSFEVQKGPEGSATPTQEVQVLSGSLGWDYELRAPWLVLTQEADTLSVSPQPNLPPGFYRTFVTIRDRSTNRVEKLPVTVKVEELTDDGTVVESLAHLFYALDPEEPYSDRAEVVCAQDFDLRVFFGQEALGAPIYVEVTHSAFPDHVFAYYWQEGHYRFGVAAFQGELLPGVDELYYAATGAEEVEVGHFRLSYLPGVAHIRIKQGGSWASSRPLFDLELVIHSLKGSWTVVDTFGEEEYRHPYPLVVEESPAGLWAQWGEYQPRIAYGSTPTALYEILFSARGLTFRYQIEHLEEGYFSGHWSYSADGVTFSPPQPFYGLRNTTGGEQR